MNLRYKAFFAVFSSVLIGMSMNGFAFAQIQAGGQQRAQQQQQPVQETQAVNVTAQSSQPQMNQFELDAEQALKTSVENDFKGLLSFPLDEQKMVSYINAARRVQRINDKWDVQIASTESDKAAMEYNNYSIEEIMMSLQRIPNLTLDQYNEMTRLISTNKEFNRVYLAYKEMVEKGRFEVEEKPSSLPSVGQKTSAPSSDMLPRDMAPVQAPKQGNNANGSATKAVGAN